MKQPSDKFDLYLEVGAKRTFAGAINWPGWCRSGKSEAEAIQALINYGSRYARVLNLEGIDFTAPEDPSQFIIVERLEGDATTDFGAPVKVPSADSRPVVASDLSNYQIMMKAIWQAFDLSVKAARGKELSHGPRGGGRELEQIIQHVVDSEASYLSRLDWKVENRDGESLDEKASRIHQAILERLEGAATLPVAARGPRGGVRWTVRYFVRRTAWHVLDHAWEIEDRVR